MTDFEKMKKMFDELKTSYRVIALDSIRQRIVLDHSLRVEYTEIFPEFVFDREKFIGTSFWSESRYYDE